MTTQTPARRRLVGDLRPSQLVYSFGIGAIVDLPHMSAMVMGLEFWEDAYNRLAAMEAPLSVIDEERLLLAARESVGPQVKELRSAPIAPEDDQPSWKSAPKPPIGVPIAPFPGWLFCPACRRLSPVSDGLFTLKPNPYRPEETRYIHSNCKYSPSRPALPARFLVACEHGHIDDFPWIDFCHQGVGACPAPRLNFYEYGSTGDARSVEIRCDSCDARRRMSEAFAADADVPGECSGRRPHLGDREDKPCPSRARTILLGASNAWFPITLSALSIPPVGDDLVKLVDENWTALERVESAQNIDLLRSFNQLAALAQYTSGEIWEAVLARRSGGGPTTGTEDASDLRTPEWRVLTDPRPDRNSSRLLLEETEAPAKFSGLLERVVLVRKLREVRALTGFTRIESPGFAGEWRNDELDIAPIARRGPYWLPAVEVRGEGVFLQFREPAIAEWEERLRHAGADRYLAARKRWAARFGAAASAADDLGFGRFLLIHSLSHALIREFALGSGYAMASIRERIYASGPDAPAGSQAGLLLYTSASDSEGTLGGLVRLGVREELGMLLDQAIGGARLCASDPPCAENVPGDDDLALNWAACHACQFVSETSCEHGNQLLDRSVLAETFAGLGLSFFGSLPDES